MSTKKLLMIMALIGASHSSMVAMGTDAGGRVVDPDEELGTETGPDGAATEVGPAKDMSSDELDKDKDLGLERFVELTIRKNWSFVKGSQDLLNKDGKKVTKLCIKMLYDAISRNASDGELDRIVDEYQDAFVGRSIDYVTANKGKIAIVAAAGAVVAVEGCLRPKGLVRTYGGRVARFVGEKVAENAPNACHNS